MTPPPLTVSNLTAGPSGAGPADPRLWWGAVGSTVLLVALALVGWVGDRQPRLEVPLEQTMALAGGFVPVGLFLVRHRGRHLVSRLVWAVGAAALSAVAAATWSATTVGAWLTQWTWWPAYACIPVILWVFPDGHPQGRRRLMALATSGAGVLGTVLLATAGALAPRSLLTSTSATLPGGARILLLCVAACAVAVAISTLASLVSLMRRARRARRAEPVVARQFLSLAPAAALFPIGFVVDVVGVPHAFVPALLALPAGLGVAIIQYGLDDLDLFVHRGVVWSVMTAAMLLGYAGVLALAQYFLPEQHQFWITVAGLAVLTALFDPLRRRVQRLVGRWLFGTRDDPEIVLMALGRRLQAAGDPLAMLASTAEEVRRSLKVPHVDITMTVGEIETTVVSAGRPGIPTVDFPMLRDGILLGHLQVSPRRIGESFTIGEARLLTEIARQAATAAEAHRLTLALQRARENLVLAREEERLRLRRDLHDGLSPIVAGSRMQLYALRGRLSDPVVSELVTAVATDLGGAARTIRELIDGLRPADLDLGLEGAVRHLAQTLLIDHEVEVTVTGQFTDLPPAVEVAGYRIAAEALTNVAKHAPRASCRLTLRREDGSLEVVVADDGPVTVGRPGRAGGVGIGSMRQRAEELGGSLTLLSEPGASGLMVRALLPLAR